MKILQYVFYCFFLLTQAYSTSLRDSVEHTISTNSEIITEYFNKKNFRISVKEEEHDYYPTIDFNSYLESSHTYNDPEDTIKSDSTKDGWNANIKIEQVLYDGGLTPNEIKEYKHRYYNIRYTSKDKVESLILETVKTYLNLVSYQELIALDNLKIEIHKKYLKLAKEKEELSGEKLDRIQVNSKISAVTDNYLEQEVNQQKAISSYRKLTGKELKGNICRPEINELLIPKTLNDAIEIALRRNNKIKAQHEAIKEQVVRVSTTSSKFKPTIKLQLLAEYDNDLKLAENGQKDVYSVKLLSNWNLFNRGKDSLAVEKEKIGLLEERGKLNNIREKVIDGIKGTYNAYFKIKARILNMRKFVSENKEIVDVYNSQLEDGSRTFLDLLNAEAELFRTKVLLIETEFSLYTEYYNMLNSLGILSDSILTERKQACSEYIFDDSLFKREKRSDEVDVNELEDELGLE